MMITKFDKYNESRFFPEDNDKYAKQLVNDIIKNFDYESLRDWQVKDCGYMYKDIKICSDDGNFTMLIGKDEMTHISKYILKKLLNFFDEKYKNKKKNLETSYEEKQI